MKKRKFVAHFADTETTDGGEIIVTTDELVEGAEVVVIGEDFTAQEGFTGEVIIEDNTIKIENDVITSVAPTEGAEEVEMATEEVIEEEVEMAATEEPEEVIEAAETTTEAVSYSKEEIDTKFNEIMDVMAEIKASMKPVEEVEEASVQMSATKTKGQLMMEKIDKLKAFKNK